MSIEGTIARALVAGEGRGGGEGMVGVEAGGRMRDPEERTTDGGDAGDEN